MTCELTILDSKALVYSFAKLMAQIFRAPLKAKSME
jgi:hypothetical protein